MSCVRTTTAEKNTVKSRLIANIICKSSYHSRYSCSRWRWSTVVTTRWGKNCNVLFLQ